MVSWESNIFLVSFLFRRCIKLVKGHRKGKPLEIKALPTRQSKVDDDRSKVISISTVWPPLLLELLVNSGLQWARGCQTVTTLVTAENWVHTFTFPHRNSHALYNKSNVYHKRQTNIFIFNIL